MELDARIEIRLNKHAKQRLIEFAKHNKRKPSEMARIVLEANIPGMDWRPKKESKKNLTGKKLGVV